MSEFIQWCKSIRETLDMDNQMWFDALISRSLDQLIEETRIIFTDFNKVKKLQEDIWMEINHLEPNHPFLHQGYRMIHDFHLNKNDKYEYVEEEFIPTFEQLQESKNY